MMVQIENAGRKKSWWRRPGLVRHGVMAFFFVFLIHVAWEHQVKGGGPKGTPSVEAYCPFGGIESLYQFATTGGFVRRIEPSALVLAGAVVLLTLLFSRGFCGWICPFGSVQEWIGLLGRRIFGKGYNPTGVWDRRLRWLKYVLLVGIVGLTWHLGVLVFRPYDPFLAFFHLGQGMDEMPWAYAGLGVVLVGSLKVERFFCRYACPLGAVIGVVGKLGLTKIVRSEDGCKGCNVCQKRCWAQVEFLTTKVIDDLECNHCMECVAHCPKPNVLELKARRWAFSQAAYGAALVAGLVGFVGVSQAFGYWRTKPAMVSFKDASGRLDANALRGWMSLKEVSAGYGIPVERLYGLAGLPRTVGADVRMNQIAKQYKLKFEPEQLREALAAELGQGGKRAGKGEHKGGEEEVVKGFMTLNEVSMKTGVPAAYILEKLKAPAGTDPRKPVREWIHGLGKSMADVREVVAGYGK